VTRLHLRAYASWVFDCDGVLLDSNKLKTLAFRELAAPFGKDIASSFVAWHQETGGVSRFTKVRHLVEELLGRRGDEALVSELIERFGTLVEQALIDAPLIPGVRELLEALPRGTEAWVVSGGLESEVRAAMAAKSLTRHFAGIYGSPATKDQILQRIAATHGLANGVFFGDARHDMEVAGRFALDFVFVSDASDDPAVGRSCERVVGDLREVHIGADG